MSSAVFTIGPEVTITELDAAPAGRYLLQTPRGRFIVSGSAVQLIRSLESAGSLAALARSPVHARELERFLEDHVLPTGVFEDGRGPEGLTRIGKPPSSYVHGARELLSAERVGRAAAALAPLFRPALAASCAVLAIAAQALFLRSSAGLKLEHISAEAYLAATLLFVLTLPLHELGHAAACRALGCRPGAMGFAFYLVFPCFYTDVTDAWRLSRARRIAVDLAGMYVQLVCAAVLALLFVVTGAPAFAAAVLMVDWSVVASLKPFLRRDGYWLLMDVVGLAAPYPAVKEYLGYLASRRRRGTPELLRVSSGLRWFTLGYVAVSSLLGAAVVAVVVWKTVTVLLPAYPAVLAGFVRMPFASALWLHNLLVALLQTSLLAGLSLSVWSKLRQGLALAAAVRGRAKGTA